MARSVTTSTGVVTLSQTERNLPTTANVDARNLKDLACRIAVNTVGQGTAAEVMKMGMIAVDNALKKHRYDARVLLQIHDELLLEVAHDQREKVEAMVKKELESVVDWNVPLVVDTGWGNNWRETD